jgi:hypothetical protein
MPPIMPPDILGDPPKPYRSSEKIHLPAIVIQLVTKQLWHHFQRGDRTGLLSPIAVASLRRTSWLRQRPLRHQALAVRCRLAQW